MDLNLKLSATIGAPVADPTDYRSLAGVSSISYVHLPKYLLCGDPREPHLAALKWILRYIRGSLHLGLVLWPFLQSDWVVYFDADWASCPDTCKSTSGYAVFLGENLVS
jgi:hypothetical protein